MQCYLIRMIFIPLFVLIFSQALISADDCSGEAINSNGVLCFSKLSNGNISEFVQCLTNGKLLRFEEKFATLNLVTFVDQSDLQMCEKLLKILENKSGYLDFERSVLLFRMGRHSDSLLIFGNWWKSEKTCREMKSSFGLSYRNHIFRKLILGGVDECTAYQTHFSYLWHSGMALQLSAFLEFINHEISTHCNASLPLTVKSFWEYLRQDYGDTILMNIVIFKAARSFVSGEEQLLIDRFLDDCNRYSSLASECPEGLVPNLIDYSLFYGEFEGIKILVTVHEISLST